MLSWSPIASAATPGAQAPGYADDEEGRQIGKTCDLAFATGGAWRLAPASTSPATRYSDAEVERFKQDWRREHAATVRFWHALERAAHRAIAPAASQSRHHGLLVMEERTLFRTLPSGRRLAYPEARLVPGKFDGAGRSAARTTLTADGSTVTPGDGSLVRRGLGCRA